MKRIFGYLTFAIQFFLIVGFIFFVQLDFQHTTDFRTNEAFFFFNASIIWVFATALGLKAFND